MTLSTLVAHYSNGLPALFVTTMVSLLSTRTLRRARRLRHHGLTVQARVVASAVLDGNVEWPLKRVAKVTFRTPAGRGVTTTITFRADRYRSATGDVMTVRYDPDAPDSAMLDAGERHGLREVRSRAVGIALTAPVAVFIVAALLIETAALALAPLGDR
jgi:hypothetical protein